jgi:hypothetical protein
MKKLVVFIILLAVVGSFNPSNSKAQWTVTCPSGDTKVCQTGDWGTVYKGEGRAIIRPSNFIN